MKRPEENYKFAMNHCIKKLKKRLKRQLNITRAYKKKEVERIFYNHYFKSVAEREGISLELFYFPKNSFSTKVMNLNSHKSISGSYVDYIKRSPQFIQDIRHLLEDEFVENLQEKNLQKIHIMVSNWELDVGRGKLSIDQIIHTVKLNKKFKLPWTKWEAISSRDATLKLISD